MEPKRFYGRKKIKGLFLLIVPLILGIAGYLVMWLWNAILPDLLGVKAISFWQATGLFLLCKILFSDFRGPGKRMGRPGFNPYQMREEMRNATPEEREALKEEWRRRCRR